jgi:4-amino-4-deoxy-L-arabinose transferase-like glycosyltransferase
MFYQPPFYYAAGAAVSHLSSAENMGRAIQMLSLGISLATLIIGLWIVHRISGESALEQWSWLAALVFAFHPTLILFSARVNNDGLVCFG